VVREVLREFFAATAATAGTLTGLLFVALSVERGGAKAGGNAVIREVRTAAALLAFTNALSVSLFGLVPNTNVGYPSAALGVIGFFFVAAGVRSILTSGSTRRQKRRQIGLIRVLVVIFGTELVCGIILILNEKASSAADVIGYALVASLLLGVGRAWELVGDRDTGIAASLAVLAGRAPMRYDVDDVADRSGPEPDGPAAAGHDRPAGD
jgi:hypothetical protein